MFALPHSSTARSQNTCLIVYLLPRLSACYQCAHGDSVHAFVRRTPPFSSDATLCIFYVGIVSVSAAHGAVGHSLTLT